MVKINFLESFEPPIEQNDDTLIFDNTEYHFSGTPVRSVFNKFLGLLVSDVFARLESEAPEISNKVMLELLDGAVFRFMDFTPQSLEFDENHFEEFLDRKAQGILARLMVTEWMGQKIRTEELMRPAVRDRDFQVSESWRIIRTLTPIWEKHEKDAIVMMKGYTWRDFRQRGGWE